MTHIFTVDDDQQTRRLLRTGLEKLGHQVDEAGSGAEALELVSRARPDAVLLDFDLPDVSGAAVCRRIKARKQLASVRIVMLTGRADEASRVECFEAGADDFVTKPFSFRELHLRIRAVIDSAVVCKPARLVVGRIALDVEGLRARVDGVPVDLSPSEFRLLCAMCRNPRRVLVREELLREVGGAGLGAVDGVMRRLRVKLGKAGACIQTVRGVGYRFEDAR